MLLKGTLDVQKPFRRGIFILTDGNDKVWITFKYENLPTFCFGCGRLGHKVQDCEPISLSEKENPVEDLLYSIALRVESSLFEKESIKFGFSTKNIMRECYYTGNTQFAKSDTRVASKGYDGNGSSYVKVLTTEHHLIERKDIGNSLPYLDPCNDMHNLGDSSFNILPLVKEIIQKLGIPSNVIQVDDKMDFKNGEG